VRSVNQRPNLFMSDVYKTMTMTSHLQRVTRATSATLEVNLRLLSLSDTSMHTDSTHYVDFGLEVIITTVSCILPQMPFFVPNQLNKSNRR